MIWPNGKSTQILGVSSRLDLHVIADKWKKFIIFSLLLEPFLFYRVPQFPLQLDRAIALVVFCLVEAIAIYVLVEPRLKWPNIGRKVSSKHLLLAFIAISFLFPLIEVASRLFAVTESRVRYFLPFIIVPFVYGILTTIKNFHTILPPRNRYLHIRRVDRNRMFLFVAGLVCARASVSIASLMFLNQLLAGSEYALALLLSLFVTFKITPDLNRFYSTCPKCRALRSRALSTLGHCPGCHPIKFRIQHQVARPPVLR